jgi:tRNA (guanine-N7-)-methyltransferase
MSPPPARQVQGVRRPLPTTGRTSSRLGAAEKAAVLALVEQFPLPLTIPARVELELGIGNGEALAARARAEPGRYFIGTDVYLNGLAQAARFATGLPNVALTNLDARELLATLPAASIQRVVVPHPDPWPKASHHKRRLVQPEFLAACARVLSPGGELWVITDWPDYAFHTLALLYRHPHLQLLQTGEAAARCKVKPGGAGAQPLGPHLLAQAPAWWVPTKYQQKAIALGRAPWFVGAMRKV